MNILITGLPKNYPAPIGDSIRIKKLYFEGLTKNGHEIIQLPQSVTIFALIRKPKRSRLSSNKPTPIRNSIRKKCFTMLIGM